MIWKKKETYINSSAFFYEKNEHENHLTLRLRLFERGWEVELTRRSEWVVFKKIVSEMKMNQRRKNSPLPYGSSSLRVVYLKIIISNSTNKKKVALEPSDD